MRNNAELSKECSNDSTRVVSEGRIAMNMLRIAVLLTLAGCAGVPVKSNMPQDVDNCPGLTAPDDRYNAIQSCEDQAELENYVFNETDLTLIYWAAVKIQNKDVIKRLKDHISQVKTLTIAERKDKETLISHLSKLLGEKPKPKKKKPVPKKAVKKPVTKKPTESASVKAEESRSSDLPPEVLTQAKEIVDILNRHRIENGLYPIPFSISLTKVAYVHVQDNSSWHPEEATDGKCNLHSWSDQGKWSSCCYTSDHAQAKCMWDKPREIAGYSGNGYEISMTGYWMTLTGDPDFSVNGTRTPDSVLSFKKSPGHYHVMMNRGIWANKRWNAVGAAISKGGHYMAVWFGEKVDSK